jgi:hypothetical protein
MATTPPNQASSTGSTTGKVRGKVKPKNRPAGTPSTPGARWNANPHHTVNYADHLANVQAKQQLGTTDLTAPPTGAQAIREANSAADLQYGPQVRAAQQAQANVQPWFADYMARVAGYANAAKTAMQPTLDEAGQLADPATVAQTQAAPGLDPNSEAGRASAMAAQGRAALAKLGQQALQTNAQSTQDTFAGQALTASREQPQAQAYAASQLAGAQSDRGAAVSKFLTDARANAQNYQIAQGTLGLNTVKAGQDAADKAAARSVSRKNTRDRIKAQGDAATQRATEKGQSVNPYGYTNEQWQRFSASHRKRIIDASKNGGGKDTSAADKKHADAITKASGGVQNTVQDIIDSYGSYSGKTTDDTSKPKDPKTGQYPARPLTDADIRAILGKNKKFTPQLIHIALMRKQGKKLGQAEVNYLHNLDPNIRIPRDWLQQEHGAQGPGSKT